MRSCREVLFAIRPAVLVPAAAMIALAGALSGCQHDDPAEARAAKATDDRTMNTLFVKAAEEQNERSSIIAERRVYSYHFRPGSPELNDLGARQVRILADAYYDAPVRITVARGDATNELYEGRVAAVRDAFAHRGIDGSRLTLNDGQPGGPGAPADWANRAFVNAPKELSEKGASGVSGGSSNGGSNSGSNSGGGMSGGGGSSGYDTGGVH